MSVLRSPFISICMHPFFLFHLSSFHCFCYCFRIYFCISYLLTKWCKSRVICPINCESFSCFLRSIFARFKWNDCVMRDLIHISSSRNTFPLSVIYVSSLGPHRDSNIATYLSEELKRHRKPDAALNTSPLSSIWDFLPRFEALVDVVSFSLMRSKNEAISFR